MQFYYNSGSNGLLRPFIPQTHNMSNNGMNGMNSCVSTSSESSQWSSNTTNRNEYQNFSLTQKDCIAFKRLLGKS